MDWFELKEYFKNINVNTGYCIYAHINKSNNKVYIGMTNSTSKRWKNKAAAYKGCSLIYNAFKKYGWDGFYHIMLFDKLTYEEACEKEIMWIKFFKKANRSYNIATGGNANLKGTLFTEGHKRKISKALIGKPKSKEAVEKSARARQGMNTKAVYMYDLNGVFIKGFTSITCAAKEVNAKSTHISRVCKGKRNATAGYRWSYIKLSKL